MRDEIKASRNRITAPLMGGSLAAHSGAIPLTSSTREPTRTSVPAPPYQPSYGLILVKAQPFVRSAQPQRAGRPSLNDYQSLKLCSIATIVPHLANMCSNVPPQNNSLANLVLSD